MIKSSRDRYLEWKYKLFYPHVRRKDAGYLASVLTEYAAFSIDQRRKMPNFREVERCATALLMALEEGTDADEFRLSELRLALSSATGESVQQESVRPDPIAGAIWLQSYMRQLFLVESAVLALQELPALVARTPFLLERFRIVADPKLEFIKRQYDQDLTAEKLARMSDASTDQRNNADRLTQEEWLRGKLVALLNEIHWWYAQSQVREELFLGQQLAVIATFVLGSVALILAFAFGCSSCNNKLAVAVMFFGLLGAFTSVMRRMRSDSEQHGGGSESTYKELTALAYGKIGITASLVFGVVFAFVLMFMFEGNFTAVIFNEKMAEIFPHLPLTWTTGATCATDCLFSFQTQAGQEFAKLLVWSFLAGFAEQLVPDALDRLTKSADSKKK